jgi:hypothetical protein
MIGRSPRSLDCGDGALDDLSRGGSTASGEPPGLRAQLGTTRAAAKRLFMAHVSLAQAEFSEIAAEIKRFAIAAGIAFGALLFAGTLVVIGGALFLGEWLFGSMGWGILHGLEFAVAASVVAVLAVLGASRRELSVSWVAGFAVTLIVGIAFGLDLANQGWARLGDSAFTGLEPGVRPLVTAVAVTAAVFAVLGLILGLRAAGLGGAIGGAIGGGLLGAIAGAFSAIHWGAQAGVAFGIAVGLAVWPIVLAAVVLRRGIDFTAIKNRFIPDETIRTTRETIEWMRQQAPLGPKS